jgi:hypothetical protein
MCACAQTGHITIRDILSLLCLYCFPRSPLQEFSQWNYADLALRDYPWDVLRDAEADETQVLT